MREGGFNWLSNFQNIRKSIKPFADVGAVAHGDGGAMMRQQVECAGIMLRDLLVRCPSIHLLSTKVLENEKPPVFLNGLCAQTSSEVVGFV